MRYLLLDQEPAHVDVVVAADPLRFGTFIIETTQKLKQLKEPHGDLVFGMGIGGSVIGDPVIHKDRIYFGACDKNFYCLDLEGREHWRLAAGDIIGGWQLMDDTIYATCFDGNLYAISLDGQLLWTFRAADKLGLKPAASGGVVYAPCRDGKLYAISREGRLLWAFTEGSPLWAEPSVIDGTIYVGSTSGNFIALDPNGRERWRFRAQQSCGGPSAINDCLVFCSWDHRIYCLDKDGKLQWAFKAGGKIPASRPTVVGDRLYIGSYDNNLYCLSGEGRLLWKYPTGNIVMSFPRHDEGCLYFASTDGVFSCLDALTGHKKWDRKDLLSIARPAKKNNLIVVACYDCRVVGLHENGDLAWTFPTSLSYVSAVNTEPLSADVRTFQLTIPPEAGRDEERYRSILPQGDVSLSQYAVKQTYTTKSRYVTS